jgi:formate-dependent nitrite reductase membrane component NrfD
MVKYTPQTQWIEGRGIWLWLAFVFGGIGTGIYMTSMYYGHYAGMVLGWLIVVFLKAGTHLLYLGKPLRAWRAFRQVKTSWISRGIIFVTGFLAFGFIQLLQIKFADGSPFSGILTVLTIVFGLLVMSYPGFAMSYVNAVPLWNNAIMPVVFVAYAFLSGFGLFVPLAVFSGLDAEIIESAEYMLRLFLVLSLLVLIVFLLASTYTMAAAKMSIRSLLSGEISKVFYIGVIFFGIIVPLVISLSSYVTGEIISFWLAIGTVSELAGSLALRYCLLKGALYQPLIVSR